MSSPESSIQNLYATLKSAPVVGVPTPAQLARLSPYLSAELTDLLRQGDALRAAEAAAHPEDKPPLADGDLFSSHFEGPTDFVVSGVPQGDPQRRAVHFVDGRADPPLRWTDTVLVRNENGRFVVADVMYAAPWDFANKGTLLGNLRNALNRAEPVDPGGQWMVRFDGVGRLRLGMAIPEVEALLGGPIRVERIEDGDSCGQARPAVVPAGLSFMFAGDILVRVDVNTAGIRTADGVQVGDPEQALVSRYGDRLRIEPHPYTGPEGHTLILTDPDFPDDSMIFETDGRVVTAYRSGRKPEVEWIEGCA